MSAGLTEITTLSGSGLIAPVKAAFMSSLAEDSQIDTEILSLEGMSGRLYRHFINNVVRMLPDARYLEIGSWAGSTLCSAINENSVRATAIDNWSQFGGPKDRFEANLAKFKTGKAYVNFIESDFRAVAFDQIGPFNIYLFDGPHEYQDQYDGLILVRKALDSQFLLVVDDWNWQPVRDGTRRAMLDARMEPLYSIEVRTTLDNSYPPLSGAESDWHNGYFICVAEQGE